MIGLFSIFKIIEPQENFMEELFTTQVTSNSHEGFAVTFSCIAYLFYIQHAYFATLMKYILELLRTLFCENVCRLIG